LRVAECREPLIEAVRFTDGDRYTLDAFAIMPNHVHILVAPHDGWSLSKITSSWKKFSARRINQVLRRNGHLWQIESFDHIVRDVDQLMKCREYIAENPHKARLKADEYYLGCGIGVVV
jgi:putative transposase